MSVKFFSFLFSLTKTTITNYLVIFRAVTDSESDGIRHFSKIRNLSNT